MKNQNRDLEELDELIQIAEKTSESARYYTEKIDRINIQFILFFALFIFGGLALFYFNFFEFKPEIQVVALIFLTLLLFIPSMAFYFQLNRYRKQVRVEKDILFRLLDMISNLMEVNIHKNNLTRVEIAILEMRLTRIKFDFSNSSFLSKNYS